jgi:hypothetical protein
VYESGIIFSGSGSEPKTWPSKKVKKKIGLLEDFHEAL